MPRKLDVVDAASLVVVAVAGPLGCAVPFKAAVFNDVHRGVVLDEVDCSVNDDWGA